VFLALLIYTVCSEEVEELKRHIRKIEVDLKKEV